MQEWRMEAKFGKESSVRHDHLTSEAWHVRKNSNRFIKPQSALLEMLFSPVVHWSAIHLSPFTLFDQMLCSKEVFCSEAWQASRYNPSLKRQTVFVLVTCRELWIAVIIAQKSTQLLDELCGFSQSDSMSSPRRIDAISPKTNCSPEPWDTKERLWIILLGSGRLINQTNLFISWNQCP